MGVQAQAVEERQTPHRAGVPGSRLDFGAKAGKARTAPCGCPVQRAGLPRPPSGRGRRRHFPDLGARVLKYAETPGLGDKIDLTKSPSILSFNGLSLATLPAEKWAVKKDGGVFDQMAGATITPRAVVKAVKEGLDFFAAHRAEILQGGKTP